MKEELPAVEKSKLPVFFGSDILSTFGDYLLFLALAVWVQEGTGSSSLAGLTVFFVALGSLTGPFTGTFVDRLPPRGAFAGSLLASALVLAALLPSSDEGPTFWVLYPAAFLYGAFSAMSESAQQVLIVNLFEEDRLIRVNALHQTVSRGLRSLVPLLGVGLFVFSGINITIIFTIICFLVAAALVAVLPKSTGSDEQPDEEGFGVHNGFFAEVKSGFSEIFVNVNLRVIILASAGALYFLNFFETLGLQVVTIGLGKPPATLAPLVTIQGLATVGTGLLLAKYAARQKMPALMVSGLLLFASSAALQASGSFALVCLAMVLAGSGLPLCIVAMSTTIQTKVSRSRLGTVYGSVQLLVGVVQALGIATGATLVGLFDYRIVCAIISLGLVTVAVFVMSSSSKGKLKSSGVRSFDIV